jgi:CDP-glycerol glycerophosphotransferase (TagB/SpsB family)
VVTYIAGNAGQKEEQTLLTAFAASWILDILPVVRLKPTIDKEKEQRFLEWITDLKGTSEVLVSLNDDLYELLAVSEVVIGFQSSVVVEAMAFGAIPVLLDILPEYNLKVINPHYDDCLVVRNTAELIQLIRRMSEDSHYLQQLKGDFETTSIRYFGGTPGVTATRFIRDYIMSFQEHKSCLKLTKPGGFL